MFPLTSFVVAITAVSSVSGLVLPRATAPAGWATAYLEPYNSYHTRYTALDCASKHNTAFFDQCCHPLLAAQKLETRPKQCIPASSSTPVATPSPTANTDEDEYDDCDDDDYDDDTSSSIVPTSTKILIPTTTKTPVITSIKTSTKAPSTAPATKTSSTRVEATPVANTANTGGFATYFYQNGVAGACGTVHKDTDMIAAIDGHRYGNLNVKSGLCGRQVAITNPANKKSVTVTIADACPTCKNSNSIDLSESAFKKIATLEEGMVGITWSFV